MRPRFLPVILATALTVSSACALAYNAPSLMLNKTTSGTYAIDPTHTSVLFSLSHMGFSNYYGRFNAVSGTLDFDPKTPENSKLKVTIDTSSIDTNNATLESDLRGSGWFDTAAFPTATFVSTHITKLTDTTGEVTGDFTLHGVTKPITLTVTFNGTGMNPLANKEELGFSAHATIKRSDFGISQYVPMVGDDVALTIESELLLQ